MADLPILDLLLFAAGTFAAALVTGVAGFAFGIVAAAAWLHFLPPAQTTALIVAYGLIVQGISVWKLRRSIQLGRSTAVPARRGDRCADRCRAAASDPAGGAASFGRYRPDRFQRLQPDAATIGAVQGRQGGTRHDRHPQRYHRRGNWAGRHRRHYLVHAARMAARRATHDVPAGWRLGLSDDRIMARRHRAGRC